MPTLRLTWVLGWEFPCFECINLAGHIWEFGLGEPVEIEKWGSSGPTTHGGSGVNCKCALSFNLDTSDFTSKLDGMIGAVDSWGTSYES